LGFLAFLQVSALVLNLIPLPPFDGFGAIEPYLPMDLRNNLVQTRGMLSFAVFFLLWYVPFINNAFWTLVYSLAQLTGVPLQLAQLGYSSFQFWVR
jgi:Zn-dependent protease